VPVSLSLATINWRAALLAGFFYDKN